ncbi:glycosyltransferase family A protein [Pseudomonas sp. App30]|uniref:glycosyltransferase family 2 protein n=1 Tax=Pseudomonas sp. App30 TaxID=3068990 RepID=UPI003A7FBB43
MKWPLVSILVPCYNHELYIEECLLSILRQDYDNVELIVVNDGSTDSSGEKIKALAQAHSFQYYEQSNQGVSAALNLALSHARGDFIITPDSDDVMLPGRLKLQVSHLQQHPEVGCVGGRVIFIDARGAEIKREASSYVDIERFDFARLLEQAYSVGAPVAMYRREAIERVGGYDPSIRIQDFQMTLKIAHLGYTIDVLPQALTLYRRHDTNISKTAYKSQLTYDMQVIDRYKDHPAYARARVAVVNKALKQAVRYDYCLARELFASLPVRSWDRVTWKRFRRYLFKSKFGFSKE